MNDYNYNNDSLNNVNENAVRFRRDQSRAELGELIDGDGRYRDLDPSSPGGEQNRETEKHTPINNDTSRSQSGKFFGISQEEAIIGPLR